MNQIVTVDIGGTHVRYAIASLNRGHVISLANEITMKTANHASFESTWDCFLQGLDTPPPNDVALAVACPVQGDVLKLTNSPWAIRPAALREKLGWNRITLINDFGAIAHAVAQLGPESFTHICGPDLPLPKEGVITVVGPGTGLGVAQLIQRNGTTFVIETEGGHLDFAPLDPLEDSVLQWMRERYHRVSVERIVSGPGLTNWYQGLCNFNGCANTIREDSDRWAAALNGTDTLAATALERLCLSLGSFAGDVALVQGANAVVLAGGIGQQLAGFLQRSGFAQRFVAKGRFEDHLAAIPVKVVSYAQPGLFGAAAAFAKEHGP